MPSKETNMSLPPLWGDDHLSDFIQKSLQNELANFVHKKQVYNFLSAVDDCFFCIAGNLNNPNNRDIVCALLLLRTHSAYLSACRLSLSGQATETFPQLRACLEFSLYALHIKNNPGYDEIWLRRHDNGDSIKDVRQKFRYQFLINTLELVDAALCPDVKQLYERCIDFGAHPNERSVTGSMQMEQQSGGLRLDQKYLHGDSIELDHALKTTAEIGLGSLLIFQHIFIHRFELLSLDIKLNKLRNVRLSALFDNQQSV
ncbi:hypothetical protein LLH00_00845 [bacterium]|nr:hypothetical protein [bacterium]